MCIHCNSANITYSRDSHVHRNEPLFKVILAVSLTMNVRVRANARKLSIFHVLANKSPAHLAFHRLLAFAQQFRIACINALNHSLCFHLYVCLFFLSTLSVESICLLLFFFTRILFVIKLYAFLSQSQFVT